MADDVLHSYLLGADPKTGEKVIDEMLAVLTKPLKSNGEGTDMSSITSGTLSKFLEADTEDNLQRTFYEKGWTDGLPIIIPTEERVNAMLEGTSASPDEIVGEIFRFDIKGMVKYTVRNVAIIAVMAGARPEHFPVILAVAATRQQAIMPSTTNFSPMLLINGPIRNEIGLNCGIGAFSPVTLANSVIGRAWTLMSTCWGYMKPRKNLWSSMGSNITYNNMCCGENEEKSPWEPFHVQHGFKAEESVVSVFRGWIISNSAGAAANRPIGVEMGLQMAAIPASYTQGTIIMDPLVAKTLKETDGFTTKQDFSKWLSDNIKIPAGQYWGYDHVDWMITPEANKGVEPFASWKKLPDDALINPYCNPDRISLVVVGGETSPLWYASDFGYGGSQSVDRWRSLNSLGECANGSCGLPDEMVDYDD
ncbi:MAG: hypothetical protein JW712_13020 [Dehalococcoidales bacterium]|nr:hypothetical protein [Dehalococcoidales bacterium]